MTTQRLAEPQALTDPGRTSTTKGEDERANPFVLWGFIIMLAGAAIGVVGKRLLYVDIVTVAGVLISLAGMFLVVYPYLAPSRRKEDDSNLSTHPEILTPPQRTQYLPEGSSTEFISSVTERTTDLLNSSKTKEPRRKENKKSET